MLFVNSSSVQMSIKALALVIASLVVSQTGLFARGPLTQSGKPYAHTDVVPTTVAVSSAERRRNPLAI